MATTRYIFLFHENLLLRFNLTTNVSAILFHIFDFNDFKLLCIQFFLISGFLKDYGGVECLFPFIL